MTDKNKELEPSKEGNVEEKYPQLRELEKILKEDLRYAEKDSFRVFETYDKENSFVGFYVSDLEKSLEQKAQEARQSIKKNLINIYEKSDMPEDWMNGFSSAINYMNLDCLTEATNFSRGFAEGTEVKSRKEKKK